MTRMLILRPLLLSLPLCMAVGHLSYSEPSTACQGSDQTFSQKAEALIAAEIGVERKKFARTAPALQTNPELTRIARARSCGMAQGIVPFSHLSPEGDFIAEQQVRASFGLIGAMGENIAERGASMDTRGVVPFSPEEFSRAAVSAWMDSDEHRANIINPHFNLSGIGVAMVHNRAVATQVFHGP